MHSAVHSVARATSLVDQEDVHDLTAIHAYHSGQGVEEKAVPVKFPQNGSTALYNGIFLLSWFVGMVASVNLVCWSQEIFSSSPLGHIPIKSAARSVSPPLFSRKAVEATVDSHELHASRSFHMEI